MKREENGISAACFGFLDEADSTPIKKRCHTCYRGNREKEIANMEDLLPNQPRRVKFRYPISSSPKLSHNTSAAFKIKTMRQGRFFKKATFGFEEIWEAFNHNKRMT